MTDLWWGKPFKSRRHHIFEEKTPLASSLCGNWMLSYESEDVDVLPEEDEFNDGEDCKECCRKAGILND